MNIDGKKISILGAVRSGIASAKLAKQNGAIPFVSDLSDTKEIRKGIEALDTIGVKYELGQHSEKIYDCDFIVTSPGIPSKSSVLTVAQEKGLKVISEIEFASWFCDGKIIAITGTNGKTTTTSLCAHVINSAGKKCYTAGNIGLPFSEITMSVKPEEFVALEVSSFQLDFINDFKPDISILLNITPDHLDRYENRYDLYIKSKMRVAENQDSSNIFIYNGDDDNIPIGYVSNKINLFPFSLDKSLSNGSFVDEGWILFNNDYNVTEICNVDDLSLKGEHNLQNALAVINVAMNIGIDTELIKIGLMTFQGVEHRLEFVRDVYGISFINDSKATNVDAVWFALRSFDTPIFLILGGTDKGNEYGKIKEEVQNRVKKIFAIGTSAEKIIKYFQSITNVEKVESLDEAVNKGLQEANSGEYILLSPACASFDMFENYEDRGNQFKEIVNQL
ncbi:MAG: UDP-N-acetylmuramoyl-L-alanine--D-glutamate ligase [Melioribacteraceae bacterium]